MKFINLCLLLFIFNCFFISNFIIAQLFTEQTTISLLGVTSGSAAWGDYDNDGDLDILLTGANAGQNYSKIYRNEGSNTFTEQTSIVITGVGRSSVAWGDYDNDGDLDILLGGHDYSGSISKIYQNNGDNSFTEQTSVTLAGSDDGSIAWGDYDNDGDLDILITGSSGSKIYNNEGNSIFSEQTNIILPGISQSSVAWGDYDNDGDLDILFSGWSGSFPITEIYRNEGNNTFTKQTTIPLVAAGWYSAVAWGDYDTDGDLDILLTGGSGGLNNISRYIETKAGIHLKNRLL